MFGEPTLILARRLVDECRTRALMIATVESCTGGLIAGAITAIDGSSSAFERGFVTYTNVAKNELVGVPLGLFERVGAVSEEVARAMAEGALSHAPVDAAVAVTGIAGPGGGSAEKPVGLVHIEAARNGHLTEHARHIFPGDRHTVRLATVDEALRLLTSIVVR